MVEKLGLTTTPHPKPYQLHWLNDDGDMVVNQQVEVEFSIGNYQDKVKCDVVPMEACHILLGRPWQFDKQTHHDGLTNKITFTHKGWALLNQPPQATRVRLIHLFGFRYYGPPQATRVQLIHLSSWGILLLAFASPKSMVTSPFLWVRRKSSLKLSSFCLLLPCWILIGNKKSWDDYLPHVEFAYNRVVHKTTNMSPFEIVYGFNPLTPLDLLPLPDVASFIHKEGTSRAEFVKKLHERVRDHIQSQTEKYQKYNNKGRKEVIFKEGDWVWLHLRKDRFPSKRKSKLSPRGDGPFQILKKINNNSYVLDLPSEYGVSSSFNVSDLSHFIGLTTHEEDALDLRTNPLQEGGDDGGGPWAKGPTTRAMTRMMHEEWAQAQGKPTTLFCWALSQAH
uniref:Retrotransposable element Tf2 n=1 Tax=Cajanus cajan TaxID=3821 RepID=A0A151QTP8_CAJCA|nr:Retrotransposable element Tf2 [Cajanus cajan]